MRECQSWVQWALGMAMLLAWPVALEADEEDADLPDSEEEESRPVAEATEAVSLSSVQRGNRMEFDGRLVRGESAGAGAVFLFERAPRPLPSMVALRSTFLQDTVREVFGSATSDSVGEVDSEGEGVSEAPRASGASKPSSTPPSGSSKGKAKRKPAKKR